MIFDADMTVDSSDLTKFYDVLASGGDDVAIGKRLVLPMEQNAMPLPNRLANRFFRLLFGAVLHQRFTDTLCGTKVFCRSDPQEIMHGSGLVSEQDPFVTSGFL